MLEFNRNKFNYTHFRISDTTICLTSTLIIYIFNFSLIDKCLYIGIHNLIVIKYLGIMKSLSGFWLFNLEAILYF